MKTPTEYSIEQIDGEYTLAEDVYDQNDNLLIATGTVINPSTIPQLKKEELIMSSFLQKKN